MYNDDSIPSFEDEGYDDFKPPPPEGRHGLEAVERVYKTLKIAKASSEVKLISLARN